MELPKVDPIGALNKIDPHFWALALICVGASLILKGFTNDGRDLIFIGATALNLPVKPVPPGA